MFSGCGSLRVSQQNLVSIYPSDYRSDRHLSYRIFHYNQDSTRIFLLLPAPMVSYDEDSTGQSIAAFSIQFIIFESYESGKIIDSATITKVILDPKFNDEPLALSFEISTGFDQQYLLNVNIKNGDGVEVGGIYTLIDRIDPYSHQSVNITSVETGRFIDRSYILPGEKLKIDYTDPGIESFSLVFQDIKYSDSNVNYSVALPPYIDKEKDSPVILFPWQPQLMANEDSIQLSYAKRYRLRINGHDINGIELQSFYGGFPYVKEPDQLVPPLRYITKDDEYDVIMSSKDAKFKVDSFWIARSGSYERARILIDNYYRRVELSNTYFTVIKEGWKTDRGMIYIVYGKPKAIYKEVMSEIWVYELPNMDEQLIFKFVKNKNKNVSDDLQLKRDPDYQISWNKAVNAIRLGRFLNMDQ